MPEQLMRIHVHATVITVPVIEVPVDQQHFRLLEIVQRFRPTGIVLMHHERPIPYHFSFASSFRYTARPPTIVAATPPRSAQPSNGVFLDFDFIAWADTTTVMSGARMDMSAAAPSDSVPPATRMIRAGFSDSSSIRRASDTTPACTSRSKQSDTAVSSPVIPNGARSNSTRFSS